MKKASKEVLGAFLRLRDDRDFMVITEFFREAFGEAAKRAVVERDQQLLHWRQGEAQTLSVLMEYAQRPEDYLLELSAGAGRSSAAPDPRVGTLS